MRDLTRELRIEVESVSVR